MTTYQRTTAEEFATRVGARCINGTGRLQCPLHNERAKALNFKNDKNGDVLLTCFGGCDREQIKKHYRDAGVLPGGKQLPAAPAAPAIRKLPALTTEYTYTDLDGNTTARKLRLPPRADGKKIMRWEHPTSDGWTKNLPPDHTHYLYRINDALKLNPDLLLIVEGEKDTDTAYDIGAVAVCNPGGAAERWTPAYTAQLPPATSHICVIADADEPGRKHARDITTCLTHAGRQVTLIELPQKDLTDYIDAGHTLADLLQIIHACTPTAGAQQADNPLMKHGVNFDTEQCNAHRFSASYGEDTRFESTTKQWYCWHDGIWAEDELIARTRARKTVELLFDELDQPMDEDVRKLLQKHIAKSQTARAQDGLLRLAQTLEELQINHRQFDQNPYDLNCLNGIVDLRTGELRPHDRSALCTQMVPVNYDPDAYCKEWETFLHAIMLGNKSMVDYLQIASGYSFTGSPICAAFFFCYGQGHNGKSTLIETLLSIAGTYGTTTNKKHLMLKNSESDASPGVAKLHRKRFASVSEVTPGDRLDEGTVKMLTGADSIAARFLHKNEVEFTPTHHLWGMGNEKPIISGTDEGIWRRIHLIPFEHHFATPDVGIKELFLYDTKAREGILAWLVRGAHIWYNNNKTISKPQRVLDSNAEYRLEMDLIAQFIADRCIVGVDLFEDATPMFKAYQEFVKDMGHFPKSQTKFGTYLREHGFTSRKSHGNIVWQGLTMLRT